MKIFKILLTLALLSNQLFAIVDFGIRGIQYEIIEPNLMDTIRENEKNIDTEKLKIQIQTSYEAKLEMKGNLPACQESVEREQVLMYEIDHDLVLPDGRQLYKKGDIINITETLTSRGNSFEKDILFINAGDPLQLKLAKELGQSAYILVVDGNLDRAAKEGVRGWKGDEIYKNFKVGCLPSLYIQGKSSFSVREYSYETLRGR